MQSRPSEESAVAIRRVHAVVNPASGGVEPGTAEALAALLSELGLEHRVTELTPETCEDAVRAAVEAAPDLVVVLGGDGTARLVAETCGPDGPLVAPLPGGTMNKLGRGLYGAVPWREALIELLARGAPRWVAGGVVGGKQGGRAFYCGAVLGAPALLAPAREAIRDRALRRAWRRAVLSSRKAFLSRVSYDFDGLRGQGVAVSFLCPAFSRAAGDDEGALSAAVLDPPGPEPGVKAGLRLALSNLIGDWRDDPDIAVPCVAARAWAGGSLPIMLDGEFFRLGRSVEIHFRRHAFRALAPPREASVEPPSAARDGAAEDLCA